MLGHEEKTTEEKVTIQLEEINQKILVKERIFKKDIDNEQSNTEKAEHSKATKENYTNNLGGDDMNNFQQPDARKTEQFWSKKSQRKEHYKKAEWIIKMAKQFEGLEVGTKAEINIDILRITLKKLNLKTSGSDGIHGFWLKKFNTLHDRRALKMNKCPQEANITESMSKGRIIVIQKDPRKGTTPNYIRLITCLPIMARILTT